jgi:hypothetical protein
VNEFTVVVNDCTAVATPGGPISVRSRDTAHGLRNFMLNFSYLTAGLQRQLNAREMDLAETVGHIFAVDLACARGRGDVVWARSIDAHLPVREPDFWQAVAPRLEAVFSDFTQDRLRLHFYPEPDANPPPRQRSAAFANFDCVALVSGGVDSFVGGLALLDEGRTPLGVSHTAAGAITHAQVGVADVFTRRLPTFERVGLTAQKNGSTFPTPEPSQRSRSLLFLTMASIAAAVSGTSEVFINENGIMAIHVPMTAARAGSLSTHTAAPTVLERLEGLLRDVLQFPLKIRNNLLGFTKPQVVELGANLGGASDLVNTVSCWSIGRTSRHCGTCAPCIMRRISFELHAVSDVGYEDDAFEDAEVLQNELACDNLLHFIRVVRDLDQLSDLDLQLNYPELLNGGGQLSLTETVALHRRWAHEARSVLSSHSVPVDLL